MPLFLIKNYHFYFHKVAFFHKIILIFYLFPYSTSNLHVFKITGFRSSLLKFLNPFNNCTRMPPQRRKKEKSGRKKVVFYEDATLRTKRDQCLKEKNSLR